MSEIMTCSKKMFDPLHPEVDLIDIEDIAHVDLAKEVDAAEHAVEILTGTADGTALPCTDRHKHGIVLRAKVGKILIGVASRPRTRGQDREPGQRGHRRVRRRTSSAQPRW